MEFLAITLVIVSAVIHAGWNLFSQQRQVTVGYFFIACLAAALCLSPLLIIYRSVTADLSPVFWVCVVVSGLFEALYYYSLCGTYRLSDLSQAYPLVRAVPVVLVALVSLALGGASAPRGIGLLGVGLVAAGCFMLPLSSFKNPDLRIYLKPASLLAASAGLGTCGYSLADNEALRQLGELPAGLLSIPIFGRIDAGAVFFLALKTLSSTAALAVLILALPGERKWLRENGKSSLSFGALTGVFIFGAYGLVLMAMALAQNVSYVVAFRQLSIPLGAFLGFLVNKEHPLMTRLVGIGVITCGLVLVALA